jgi:hypothetical protein
MNETWWNPESRIHFWSILISKKRRNCGYLCVYMCIHMCVCVCVNETRYELCHVMPSGSWSSNM